MLGVVALVGSSSAAVSASASAAAPSPQAPSTGSLVTVVSADEAAVVAGEAVHLHVTVVNTGAVALHGVVVADDVVSSCGVEAFDLAVGAVETVDCAHDTVEGDVGTWSFTAEVDADELDDPVVSNQVDVIVLAPAPSLVAIASADETGVVAGEAVHLHVTVVNTGNVALHGVVVADDVVSSCGVEAFDLAVGAVETVDCAHDTVEGDAGTWSFTAEVDADELDDPVVSNQVDVAVDAAAPALDVVASADEGTVTPGDPVHFHVAVTNTGNVALHAVTVTDELAPGCEAEPFDLAVAARETLDCTVETTASTVGPVSNMASVVADELAEPVESNQVDVQVEEVPGLSLLAVSDESSVVAGEDVHLHLTVVNTGNVALHGVTITDELVPGCEAEPFDLVVGEERTVDCAYTTVVDDVGTWSDAPSVVADEVPAAVVADAVEVEVVAQDPSLSLVAVSDESSVVAGEDVHLHLTVVNTGNVALHGVTITDELVPGCEAEPFDLVVGEERTVDCAYTTVVDDVGTWSDAPSVVADEVPAAVVADAVEVEVVAQDPSLTGVLTADETTVVAGEVIHLHVTVVNTGNVALHGTMITNTVAVGCNIGGFTLGVGVDLTLGCQRATTAADVGTWTNAATVDADGLAEPVDAGEVSVEVVAAEPGLSVSLNADEDSVLVGERIHLQLDVVNTGNVVLHDVIVTDDADTDCEVAPFDLAVAAELSIGCSYLPTEADVGTWVNVAHTAADEVPTPVSSEAVEVEVESRIGQVSGHVADSVTGDPVEGALVTLLAPSNFSLAGIAETDLAGDYDLTAPIGNYFAYLVDPSNEHTATFYGTPATVSVTSGGTTAVDQDLDPSRGSFAGTITDEVTGDPLEDILVIGVDALSDEPSPGAITDENGDFVVGGLPAGANRALFADLSGGHDSEYYDDEQLAADSDPIEIAGGFTTDAVDAELAPRSVPDDVESNVVGTVTDAQGVPLEGIAVAALHAVNFNVEAGVVTDRSGAFSIPVRAGAYKVTYYDIDGEYQQAWYDGRSYEEVDDADILLVPEGEDATADIQVEEVTGSLGGTVTDAGTGDPVEGEFVAAVSGAGVVSGTAATGADGTYVIDGLRPGPYLVRFIDPTAHYASEWDGGAFYTSAATTLVEPGVLAGGVDAALHPNVDVQALLDGATLRLRAASVGEWDGETWPNSGTGGAELDATRLGDDVTFVPAGEPGGPAFKIPSANPGGQPADDGFAVPGDEALADLMGGSNTFTVAFTPLYVAPPTMRYYRKYTGTDIVTSGTGFVIEETPLLGGLMATTASAPGVGAGIYPGVRMLPGRQAITLRLDRDAATFTVFRNGAVLKRQSTATLGDVTDLADLIVGPGQLAHEVCWHGRALTDQEVIALHGAL